MDTRAYNPAGESYRAEPFQCGICYTFLTAEIDVLSIHIEEHLKQLASVVQLDHYQRCRAWQGTPHGMEGTNLPPFNRFADIPSSVNSGQSQQLGSFVNSQFADVKVENPEAAECGGTSLSDTSNWIACVDEMLSAANHGESS